MARKKDLAGLAALAGLAYMMTRDKAQKGEAPKASASAATPTATATTDTGGDFIKAGSGPRGDFMNEVEPGWGSSTASPRKAATTRSVAAPKAADGTAPLVYKDDFGMGKMAPGTSKIRPGGLGTSVKTMKADNGGRRVHPEYPEDEIAADKRDAQETARDLIRGQKGYAKGGSVKGWGMARGARKAKTY
jgi:hypothetical protein